MTTPPRWLTRRRFSVLGLTGALATSLTLFALSGGALQSAPAATVVPPKNTALPFITGTAQVGQTLTAQEGTFSGTQPFVYTYQWLTCGGGGNNCSNIAGATGKTYVVKDTDFNRTLRVQVTATNSAGSDAARSNETKRVKAATPTPPPPPPSGTVPIESVVPPERLLIQQVTFSPNRITSLRQNTSVTVRVTTTKGAPVRGALVFIRSTPVVTSTPPEQATGNNGTTTFNVVPESDLALFFRDGYNLQFFVRARKAGENSQAGVSSRRLVQVKLDPQS